MIEGEAEIGKEGSDQGEGGDQWLRERDNSDRQGVRFGVIWWGRDDSVQNLRRGSTWMWKNW